MNQNPEQIARDTIDKLLIDSGWIIQSKKEFNLGAATGIAVREYQTSVGPADYVLFVNRKPLGIIEAKREELGVSLIAAEDQSQEYAMAKLRKLDNDPLPFVYESTGIITRFTNFNDPKPRSRQVFSFHRPETLLAWSKEPNTIRARFSDLPILQVDGFRDCQITAITNLEKSFREQRPKALIQMATGSGKTFTAISFIYRLLKYSKAKRILFLVDTKNLGEQAESEFRAYTAKEDNRLFTELYGVTRLQSSFIPNDSQVYISTIQRMYSILKGTELDESLEEENPNEQNNPLTKTPVPVEYNEQVPIEFFDFIVIDECHRSIYNLWKQVLDYFDAFQIGLTATPDNRTFGYFDQNLVCDYGYEKAVIDGVLVPYNVFTVETTITNSGAKIEMGQNVDKRERQTRKKFWETVDDDIFYTGNQLDKDIVNPSTIRTIIRAMKENLPAMFPDRYDSNGNFEVPKTLIFAKSDSHAEDIIDIVRTEFGEENKFCKKITYRSEDDPKTVLQQFRNEYYPRIAVTVDMIATGTDIRPLEVLLFMRDVRSRSYYEQMKGRGTRTCSIDELRSKGTPTAKYSKDHFVIIDAIGVENSVKTDSRPLERAPGASMKDLLDSVAAGNTSEDVLTTLANRLLRLDRQLSEKDRSRLTETANGSTLSSIAGALLNAYDPDRMDAIQSEVRTQLHGESPDSITTAIHEKHEQVILNAVKVFDNPQLRQQIIDIRRLYDQIIDTVNIDSISKIGWQKDQAEKNEQVIADFKEWIETHKNEITALQIFYAHDYRNRQLSYKLIKDLAERLKTEKPTLAPLSVWKAYEQLEAANGSVKNELIALVSLIRRIAGIDSQLTSFDRSVDNNFKEWIFKKNAGKHNAFTEEQLAWLRMIKDFIAGSFHVDTEDFELDPFNKNGGLSKFYQVFGAEYEKVLEELNKVLVA